MSDLLSSEEAVEQEIEDIKDGKESSTEEEDLQDEESEDFEDQDEFDEDEDLKERDFEDVTDDFGAKPPKKVEEEEEEAEEEEEEEPKPGDGKSKEQLSEDLEVIRKLIDTGDESVGKVKDSEIDFSKLTPKERLMLQQKGWRFYQAMEENSQKADELRQAEAKLIADAKFLNNLMQSGQLQGKLSPTGGITTPPELQDDDMDDDQTKALKAFGRTLLTEVSTLKQSAGRQELIQGERELLAEVEKLQKGDYPLASTEEIIAVKAMYNDIPIERIASKSQQKYGSVDWVSKVFEHCPDVRQHFSDLFAKERIARNQKVIKKNVAQRTSSSVRRVVAERKPKSKGLDYDWDDLETDVRKRLRQIAKIHEEEEFE